LSRLFLAKITVIVFLKPLPVPDGVIVASCFHTGYFALRFFRPIADAAIKEGGGAYIEDFDKAVDGFCTDYESMMPQRTTFVRALSQIKDANDF
jgi:hypothetical protein